MDPQIIDCLGMPCPQPVLRAKQALEEGAYAIEVLVDNEASQNNVARFGRSQGHTVQTVARGNSRFAVTIVANGSLGEMPVVSEDYQCQVPKAMQVLYVISSDTMGRGSEQLGWALLQTYVQTIKDVSPQPHKIVLYNSGVRLVATESGALEALRSLQAAGVEILACGTCLDFYQLKSAMQVGQISNMHEIMTAMAEADKIVSPF